MPLRGEIDKQTMYVSSDQVGGGSAAFMVHVADMRPGLNVQGGNMD